MDLNELMTKVQSKETETLDLLMQYNMSKLPFISEFVRYMEEDVFPVISIVRCLYEKINCRISRFEKPNFLFTETCCYFYNNSGYGKFEFDSYKKLISTSPKLIFKDFNFFSDRIEVNNKKRYRVRNHFKDNESLTNFKKEVSGYISEIVDIICAKCEKSLTEMDAMCVALKEKLAIPTTTVVQNGDSVTVTIGNKVFKGTLVEE